MNQGQGGAGLEHHHLKEGRQAGNQAGRNRGIPHRNDRRKRERRKQKSSGNTDHSKGNTNRLPSTDARSCSCWVSSSLPLLLAHLLGFLGPRRLTGPRRCGRRRRTTGRPAPARRNPRAHTQTETKFPLTTHITSYTK